MRKLWTIEAGYIAAAAAVAIGLLFVEPFVGVADNGDFYRVMRMAGLNTAVELQGVAEQFFGYAQKLFDYDDTWQGVYYTSQAALVILARAISRWNGLVHFDIRLLGAIYTGLFLCAVYLLLKYSRTASLVTSLLLAAAMLFVFSDIGYMAYFNSLYGEPAAFVFLLLCFGYGFKLLHESSHPSLGTALLWLLAVLCFVSSKAQYAPLGLFMAAIALRMIGIRKDGRWRWSMAVASLLIVAAALAMIASTPPDLKRINVYQSVFYGLLPKSGDVEGDLRTLGLPDRLAPYTGIDYFHAEQEGLLDKSLWQQDALGGISHREIALFYARQPGRLWQLLREAAPYSMNIRPYSLGNYELSAGEPYGALAYTFSGWSEGKARYMPGHPGFWIGLYALYTAGLAFEWLRSSKLRSRIKVESMALLSWIGAASYVVAVMGDGLADISKHLFLFNVVTDAMLITVVVWVVHQVIQLRHARRARWRWVR